MAGKHHSHRTRFSFDASTFDEMCELCGNTDKVPGGWLKGRYAMDGVGQLAEPCPASEAARNAYDDRQAARSEQIQKGLEEWGRSNR